MLVTSIIPIYFHKLAEADGLSSSTYLSVWSAAAALVTFLMLFIGPILGSYSDRRGWRKTIFITLVLIGALSCIVLGIPTWWVAFLLVFIIGKIAYNASIVIYDSMLNDVATDEEMDDLSSKGYAMGYIGSCIPFIICLVFVIFSDMMAGTSVGGMTFPTVFTFQEAVVISLVITAVWWLIMSLPLFKSYEQVHYNDTVSHELKEGLLLFVSTIKDIAKEKSMWLFILAFFFYIDGVNTIIELSAAFGEALDLGSAGLLGALLLSQIVMFPSTLIMSKLSYRFGTHRIILASIVGYICISVFALFINSIAGFFVLAFGVGLFQGSIQALSRSYFGRMVPKNKTGEYFGILDIFAKGSTIIGTAAIAVLTPLTGDVKTVAVVLFVMFGLGLLLFMASVKEKNYDVRTE